MSHENSDTIGGNSRYYNVYGGTQFPLPPVFGFERSVYPTVEQAVNAAQWRSRMGGGPDGGQSPSYGFHDRSVQNPYAQMLGSILDGLNDPRTQAQLVPGMALLRAPQALYNASRVLPNLLSERGSVPLSGWPPGWQNWGSVPDDVLGKAMSRAGGFSATDAPKTVDAQGNIVQSAHAWARNLLDRWQQWGRMREEAIQSGMPADQADEALRYMNMNPIGYDETMALKKIIPDQN